MKILFITNGITGSGGLERVLSVKASLLAEDFGYKVHLLSLNETGKAPFFTFSEKINRHSVEVAGNPLHYMFHYRAAIQKMVDEVQPDLISVCDDGLKGFFLPLMIRTAAKWIHESHASFLLGDKGSGISFFKKAQHHLKQILGKSFSKIILLTEGNKKEWQLKNLMVIPNPVPFQTHQTASGDPKKIITVGSYSYNKGYDLLLTIWSKIEKDFPAWELHVYGRNTYEILHRDAENLKLKNIRFHDPVPDIENEFVNSSLLVLPSRSEGFGMVLIEAMSCGLPVVSFACPHGPADIITEGEDGFLIPTGNTEMFAAQLGKLMNDEGLRKEMGRKAVSNVQRFSAEKIVQIWDKLFKTLQNQIP